ncbi:lysylphosphatidylglycerol synthase transmembrane domain-containing protein [Amycolatopsis orientalis]|uniref:lysylphosphatidylglycerol synthase transmembrane domain-containing protein n=1 Tax=Amycolatopsis orientalis TaxID=31958 RepID=UPI0005613D22|nr:lysylphosphatidylglycerol synthase domain-containing protein [Amycolatopsis orientalis]
MIESRSDALPSVKRRTGANTLIRWAAAVVVVVALVAFVRTAGAADLGAVFGTAEPLWVFAAVVVFLVPLLGNVLVLRAVAPVRLPWGLTTAAQLAGAVGNLAAPGNLGGMATNVRFLHRRGVATTGAAGAVGAAQAAAVVVTVALALPGLIASGRLAAAGSVVSGPVLPIAALVLLAVGVTLRCTAAGRRWAGRVRSVAVATLTAFRLALAAPGRAGLAVAGNLLVTLGSTAALAAAVRAFGAAVPFGDLLLVVAGSAFAGLVPLPGGAGGAEVILAAQLTAVGLQPPVALAAAVLHRVVTFWSRVPVGWFAFAWLRRAGHL